MSGNTTAVAAGQAPSPGVPGQAVLSPHRSRPGRRALVTADLAALRGPTDGAVELPLRLFWSLPDHRFDLDDPDTRRWYYETVLREASRAGGPHHLPRRCHARPVVARPVPAQGGPARLGGAAPVPAGGRRGLMPLSELHRRVATVALRVATRYGFALGGGNALIAHGLITRPTQDVDLFTNEETGVEAAAGVRGEPRCGKPGSTPSAKTMPPGCPTSSKAWATAWPSGPSPRPTGSR